jgi:transposase
VSVAGRAWEDLCVLGRVDRQGSLLTPGLLLADVVSKGSFYDRLAQVGPELIKDEDFAHLYARGQGRPSIPPSVLMRALLLATKDGTGDRESARRSRADLDWKHALGLELDHGGIGATTFSSFRARVVLHDTDQQLFRATLRRAVDLGLFPTRSWR